MTGILDFDAVAARQVEAVYTTPDVVEQRRRVLDALAPRPGERVIDIGVGPGLLAAEIAAAVGPDGLVCGVDVSDSMLALAASRADTPGSGRIELRPGGAERLPYPDGSFDAAVSTQVFEYVQDIAGALAEVHRVLRPGGRVLLLDTDWDSIVWHTTDRDRMARVLTAWEQHLADPHLPRTLRGSLERAGFTAKLPEVFPLLNVGYHPESDRAGVTPIIAAFVTGRDGLGADEVRAWAAEPQQLGAEHFFSLNRYLFRATTPA